jgi:hypothetical protein
MFRIGIWFDITHVPYGGPAHVLIGTLLGILQAYPESVVLLNETGDYNWLYGMIPKLEDYKQQTVGRMCGTGPMTFTSGDAFVKKPEEHKLWMLDPTGNTVYLAPSLWYAQWISNGLPFRNNTHRPLAIWGAGVNTDRFLPLPKPVAYRHDYFIYFKSQNWDQLRSVHDFLFHNYFKLHGPILMYYFYSSEELLEMAQRSRFCIFLSGTETQGLASLEIMACGCPLFVLDTTEHIQDGYGMSGATSVTCWDSTCGMKSSVKNMEKDFPVFMEHLETYNPRSFVEREYSWKASAGKLVRLIAREHHES